MDDKVYLAYYELMPFFDHQFKIIGVSRTYEGAERLIELWLANYPFKIDDMV